MNGDTPPSEVSAGAADRAPAQPTASFPGTRAAGAYRVLARTYRPSTFRELIGQDALVRTLTNAIRSGRVAHAFILTGVRGVGKTTTARIIARALNCTGPDGGGGPTPDPCGVCDNCRAIAEDRHVDVLEMDAASRTGIGDIREIIENVRYAPAMGRFKVYIIDEVHMLSQNAFNGLLKTLEEPPPHVKFVFATTEIRRVPITVLSRCQRFDLRRVERAMLEAHFSAIAEREGVTVAPEALALVARAADGSVRDGLSLLDQAIALADGPVTADRVQEMLGLADRARLFDLYAAAMKGEAAPALTILADLQAAGSDPLVVVHDLLDITHFLTRARMAPSVLDDAALPEVERTQGQALAATLDIGALQRVWQMLMKGIQEVQAAPRPAQALEMLVIRLIHAAGLPTPGDALKRLKELGAFAPQASAGPSDAGPRGSGAPRAEGVRAGAIRSAAGEPQAAGRGIEPPLAAARGPQASAETGAASPPPAATIPAPPAGPSGLRAAGDGGEEQRTAATVAAAVVPLEGAAPAASPSDFPALVRLFDEHGDKLTYARLMTGVHPVSFRPGRLELRLKPGIPASLLGDVSRGLLAWTGQPWMITLSDAEGEPTLREREREAVAEAHRQAAEHPLVRAALDTFPGATIQALHDLTPQPGGKAQGDDGAGAGEGAGWTAEVPDEAEAEDEFAEDGLPDGLREDPPAWSDEDTIAMLDSNRPAGDASPSPPDPPPDRERPTED